MGQKREEGDDQKFTFKPLLHLLLHHFFYLSFQLHRKQFHKSCFVIEVFMLILWPTPDAANRKNLWISCCCWSLTHTEGYLYQITQNSMLSVANGALRDWDSPGAPRSCSPALQSTCTQASPAVRLRLLPHFAWFMANELTKRSLKVSRITKLWTVCRTRMSSVIAVEVSQIELLRLSAAENDDSAAERIFLSSFNRKYLCVSAQ